MRTKRDLPPAVDPQSQSQIVTQEREYKLITPLFGGGAIPGERDEVTIVRGTEIRGHLRFWWRACYGGRYKTVAQMKKAEDRLWGAAAGSKKTEQLDAQTDEKNEVEDVTVQVAIKAIEEGQKVYPFTIKNTEGKKGNKVKWAYNADSRIPAYAAFSLDPARTHEEDPTAKPVYDNVKFCLTISFPQSKQKEVQGALWAWETFGGVGARTRRGFGAVSLQEVALVAYQQDGTIRHSLPLEARPVATATGVKEWLIKKFSQFDIEEKALDEVPSLSKYMFEQQLYTLTPYSNAKDAYSDAKYAWNDLIEGLRTFRQPGRGRDKWPDTLAVKKLRDTKNALAQSRYTFPKAVLGLPIVFHFPDEDEDVGFTLQGAKKGRERLASSLLLRPLECRNGYVGLVLLLENHPKNHTLSSEDLTVTKDKKDVPGIFVARVSPQETRETALQGETDVWEAFMAHIRRRGKTKKGNNR